MQESATGASFIYISYVKKKKKCIGFYLKIKKQCSIRLLNFVFEMNGSWLYFSSSGPRQEQ